MPKCKEIWDSKPPRLSPEDYIEWCWDMGKAYIDEVESGEIPVKIEIKRAIKRHQKYVDLAFEPNSIYEWKPEKIEKAFAFFSFLNGEKGQFKLMPYQVFILIQILGLYYRDTDERVVNHLFLFIPAKNGKTTFNAALMVFFFSFDGKRNPTSITIAKDKKQAGIAMHEACKLIEQSRMLNNKLKFNGTTMDKMTILFKDGRIGEARSYPYNARGIQGVNPDAVILDEVHVYKDHEMIEGIEDRLGTKKNTMVFMPTTAGLTKDGKSVAMDYVNRGIRMLDPNDPVEDPSWVYIIYGLDEGDDPNDEINWYKAQPALGFIKDYKAVKAQYDKARVITSNWDNFKMFQLNIFTENKGTWIPTHIFSPAFKEDFNKEDFEGCELWGGSDLSTRDDLSAFAWIGKKDEKFFGWIDFFIANNQEAIVKDSKDLTQWINDGWIYKTETSTIDSEYLKEYVMNINSKFKIKKLKYDPNKSVEFIAKLEKEGLSSKLIPMIQSHRAFNPAVEKMEELFLNSSIDLEFNPCSIWNFNNVVIHKDYNLHKKFEKKDGGASQDGVVAFGMATSGWLEDNADTSGEQAKKQLEAWMALTKN